MSKENTFYDYYQRFKDLDTQEILNRIKDLQAEMEPFSSRVHSEGFKTLNDSSNNLMYSVLVQLLEEHN